MKFRIAVRQVAIAGTIVWAVTLLLTLGLSVARGWDPEHAFGIAAICMSLATLLFGIGGPNNVADIDWWHKLTRKHYSAADTPSATLTPFGVALFVAVPLFFVGATALDRYWAQFG